MTLSDLYNLALANRAETGERRCAGVLCVASGRSFYNIEA